MPEAFLRLVEVTKRFGRRTVVDNVSLDVAEGETVALLGASGCGKTTTLRLVAGLEEPDAGEIWIAGECVAANGKNLVPPGARGVGFVFQDLALWPHLTVAGNLEFVLSSAGVPKRERAERVNETLRLMRIDRFARSLPERAFRRRATTRGDCARDNCQSVFTTARRADVESGRGAEDRLDGRTEKPAKGARCDHRLHHARPCRGPGLGAPRRA